MGIEAKQVEKSFGFPPHRVLKDITLSIPDGEFISISGRSGSGKTTLLYLLSTLDRPTSGVIQMDGKNPYEMNSIELHKLRNRNIGFIFQFHYLLPELTSLENILLPARKQNLHVEKSGEAKRLMDLVGLSTKYDRFPSQMSGGEQQRVAIARALLMKPKYIFADEPTGNLDTYNSLIVMDLLKKIHREEKTTVVLVTHEPDYAAMASRKIELVDGEIKSDQKN
jgi:lipoprotein-releasing system ATP-binding protein